MSILLLLSDCTETHAPLRLSHGTSNQLMPADTYGESIRIPGGIDRCVLLVRERHPGTQGRWAPFAEMPAQTTIVPYSPDVRGSACVALLGSGEIDDGELLIVDLSAPQPEDHAQFLTNLRDAECDAGVGVFASHDPRWAHVRIDPPGMVEESVPTTVVTDSALSGIYYFRNGRDWVNAAKDLIRKDRHDSGHFQLAATINEMILMGRRVIAMPLDGSDIAYCAVG